MANGWLAGLGGFSQGLSRGLEQGWDAQQRQQEIDAAKYTRSLQNLSTALTMADLYPEMRGSLLKTWGEQNRRQGVGFDPALTEILAKAPTEASQDIAQLLSGGHEQWAQAIATNPRLKAAFAKDPFAVGRFMLELKKQSQDQDALQTTQKILTRAQPKTVFPVAPMEAGAPAQGAPSGTPAGEPVSPARVRLQELQTQIETINEQYSALVRSGKKQMPGVREGLDKEIHRLETARDRLSMSAFAQELGPRTQRYVGKGMDEGSARNQAAMDLLAAGMKPPPGLEHFAPGQKEFAPTELQGWLTEAARQLGKTYRPGGPIDPDVNKLALKLYQDWRRETFAPKGPETSIAWRAAQLARSQGASEEEVSRIYERALRDSRFGLSYLGAAGGKMGQFGVESGEAIEPPTVFPGPEGPGSGAPTRPTAPGAEVPFGGEPGKPPIQKRQEAISTGGQAGDVAKAIAKLQKTRATIDEIDILSKPLITAKKAPDTWWQKAGLAGGRITNYDQLAKFYKERTEVFLGNLSRTVGEQVGVLTDMDLELMRRGAIPRETDSMAQRDMKITALMAAWTINMQAEKARLESGGILPDAAFDGYRQKIQTQLDKIEQAAGVREPAGKGTAMDFLQRYNVAPGRK